MGLFKLIAAAAAGIVGYRVVTGGKGKRGKGQAAFAPGQTDDENFAQVRDAGPEAMRDPSRRPWSRTDERSDESFPASDPPGSY